MWRGDLRRRLHDVGVSKRMTNELANRGARDRVR